jgi:hypothetical protein
MAELIAAYSPPMPRPVMQLKQAKLQGAGYGAADVAGRDVADVLVGQAEGLLVLEDRADRADKRYL